MVTRFSSFGIGWYVQAQFYVINYIRNRLKCRIFLVVGNDNLVNIWSGLDSSGNTSSDVVQQPLYTFNQHHAAVRALAWCPWNPSIIATGGGTKLNECKCD